MAQLPVLTRRRADGGNPHRNLVVDRSEDLRLFRSRWAQAGLVLLLFLYWYLPTHYFDDTGLRTMSTVGAFAIGAIGLNLLSGYTGQISLGHAFFIAIGSYTVGYLGVEAYDAPLVVYLPVAALISFAVGAAIGPFALRLRGVYLVIVTIGLIFVGRHLFNNWESVTGGSRGLRGLRRADMSIGPIDFSDLSFLGHEYSSDAGKFFLIWALVAVAALLAKNIVRTRPGRAMQAIRDRDLSAEVIGVDLARTKVMAFAISSAYAGVAGVLHGVLGGSARPTDFGLVMSITFIAIIIIGGIGTIFGSILGAIFVVGGEEYIRNNSSSALFDWAVPDLMSVGDLTGILFGLFVVLFLLFEPRGLAALWLRFKIWLVSWPFKY
jgi:branched-chain amino acid transport system permease protein